MTLTTLLILPLLGTPPSHPASSSPIPITATPVFFRHDRDVAATLELGARFDGTVQCGPADSGTLIGERWVLTAAHVADGLSPFSPHVRVNGERIAVVRRIFHPDAVNDEDPIRVTDLALLELARPVKGVDPVPLYRQPDEVGRGVFVVGYGDFGAAQGEVQRFDGRRRGVTNVVDRIEFGHLLIDLDAPDSDEATELEGIGCYYKDWNFDAGLVDFPAEVNGEEVLLCWRSDEKAVEWYHTYEDGYSGRKRIEQMPGA